MTPREARGQGKHYPGAFQGDLTGRLALSLVLEPQAQQEDREWSCVSQWPPEPVGRDVLEGCSDRKVGLPKLFFRPAWPLGHSQEMAREGGIPAHWLCVGWVRALRMRSLAGFPSLRLGASGISWQVRE